MRFPDSLLIDGKWISEASGGTIELTEPANEQPLCAVPAAGPREVDRTLEAAARAFASGIWSGADPTARGEVLYRIAARIRADADMLARIEARNVGKPIGDARWEIEAGARCFEYYAGAITRFVGKTVPVTATGLNYTLHVPVGVVACIVPWNFPFLMACWKTAPALVTGNTAVLKPASQTPLTALALGKIAMEAGLPEGVLQVIAGRGADIGDHLVSHPLVRKITFTGETVTGARIVRQASDDIKRVSLELGGKSPNVVFADADVELAARRSPMGVFANTGQDCCARSRILVERSAYDRFVDAYVAATRALVVGDPLDDATQIGPMVSAGQRKTSERYIEIARAEGGRILCGADRPRDTGYYLSPTVVDQLPESSAVCREEIFGPVACIIPFDTEAEAIALANATEYGLSGSLWTRDVGRALRVARAIESGVIGVNSIRSVFTELPFGGFKRSGFGRDLGMEALGLYTETKSVFIDTTTGGGVTAGGAAVPEWLTSGAVDTVMVAFPDPLGRLMGKRFDAGFFRDHVVGDGTHACNYLLTVDIDMNPLDGFTLASWDKGYGDFHLHLDPTSYRRVPWLPGTALVLADLEHDDGMPVEEAPRRVLGRQLERLAGEGMIAMTASELEFYLYHETYHSAAEKRHRQMVPSSDYLIDYHLLATSRDENVLGRLRRELTAAGVVVEGTKGEWGKGQHELNLMYAEALESADRHVLAKHAAKEIAAQQGRAITFMAKPATDEAGSSCHVHMSLWDAGGEHSRFADASGEAPLFRQFLGGLIRYGRELSLLFAPTVNSYKRYQAASWAPTALVWAHDNRTTGYRVVGRGSSLRVENRMPGADVNPYLAYAAMIAAGLAGIEERLDPGEAYRGNAYVDDALPKLPPSLDEAARLLDGSKLARSAFGDSVVDFLVHGARLEAAAAQREVTDWERARYFERI